MSTGAPRLLDGVRVVELGGIGPVPHACMLLASLGADVVRVERSGAEPDTRAWDATRRGRTVISADLKSPEDVRRVRDLVAAADVLVEASTHPHLAARSVLRNDPDGVLAAAAPREVGAEASYLTASTRLSADDALGRWRGPAQPAAPRDLRSPGG